VVPDYKAYFDSCYQRYGPFAKSEFAKLVWTFQAVPVDEDFFPLGVKTTYRAFAAAKTAIIQQDPDAPLGYSAVNVVSMDEPQVDCSSLLIIFMSYFVLEN
jgi:hypothetical protein